MSSPQGKPRVYFCCHPDDFNNYFEEISEEILSKQNCSIWYDTTSTEIHSSLAEDLNLMQLFVIPITYRFLTEESRGFKELEFAKENNIPILPLLQDINLVELFNQRCGNLQYLNKYATDPTEISYDTKLSQFLNSILISDELAEEIRREFDAYIFLSYRKIDRKYAQKLMNLIHKHEAFQSVGIWYDEFLIPGEDFNKNIDFAFRNCDTCVLVVTKHLAEQGNYIISTEYPTAKKRNLPILPFAFDDIAYDDLYSLPDLPSMLDPNNEKQLITALYNALKDELDKKHSPKHDYLMGLAYLKGIDVEVNSGKALVFIMRAASAGYLDAIQKVANMLYYGECFKQMPDLAISWKRKHLKACLKENKTNNTSETTLAVFRSLNELVSFYFQQNKAQDALNVLLEYLLFVQAIPNKIKENQSVIVRIAYYYIDLSRCYIYLKDYTNAKTYLEIPLQMEQLFYQNHEKASSDVISAICYKCLLDIAKDTQKWTDAQKFALKRIQRLEYLIKHDPHTNLKSSLADTYMEFADLQKELNNYSLAQNYGQKALPYYYSSAENISGLQKISKCLSFLFDISFETSDITSSVKYCNQFDDILRLLEKFNKQVPSMNDNELTCYILINQYTAKCCRLLGDHFKEKRNFLTSISFYMRSIKHYKNLYPVYNSAEYYRSYVLKHIEIGWLYLDLNDSDSAKTYYLEALNLLSQKNPLSQEKTYDLTILCYKSLLHNYAAVKDYPSVQDCYLHIYSAQMDLWNNFNPPDILLNISITLVELGNIYVVTKEFQDAETNYKLALNALDLQRNPPADPNYYLRCYQQLSFLYKITGNSKEAEVYAQKCNKLNSLN